MIQLKVAYSCRFLSHSCVILRKRLNSHWGHPQIPAAAFLDPMNLKLQRNARKGVGAVHGV